jgi:tetratricopeptide (TPR) repeat protein
MARMRRGLVIIIAAIVILLIGGGTFLLIERTRREIPPEVPEPVVQEPTVPEEPTEPEMDEVENMMKLARYYIEKEEYDLARIQLEQVLLREPDNEQAKALLEQALDRKRTIEKEELKREENKLDRVVTTLKETLPEKGAEERRRQREEQARLDLEKEKADRLKQADDLFLRGKRSYERGDYTDAISNFKRSLSLKPGDAVTLSYLGSSYFEEDSSSQENVKKAIESSKKALSIDPTLSRPHFTLGQIYDKQDLLDSAVVEYKKTLELDPNNGMAYYKLGIIQYLQRDYRAALKSFTKASELLPDFPQAYYNLGLTAQKLGQTNTAINAYNGAIRLKKDYTKALINLGLLYYENNFYDRAIGYYREAISQEPASVNAHIKLGDALRAKQQFEEAKQSYEKALRLDPKSHLTYYNLSILYEMEDRYDLATGEGHRSVPVG